MWRKDLYRMENKKNLFTQKIEKIVLSKLKKYHDYDIEYKGIRDVKNSFDLSIIINQ